VVTPGQRGNRRGQDLEAALIRAGREKMTAARKRWLSVAVLCACMTTLVPAAILPTDLEARVGANYEPMDADERAIWQSLARLEEGIRTSPQRLVAPELDAYIRGVSERLIGRPAPDLRIYVMRDASLNAAMLPSGLMIVNTGLLARVRDEAQLAAVLAHEAGHYFRRHSLDLLRNDRRTSALVSSASSASHSYSDTHGAWNLINQAVMMSSYRFSRDLESEADAYGLTLMARAGYRPRAALEIWEQVIDERQAGAAARQKRYRDGTNSELSTHPPTLRRMSNLADTADYLAGKLGTRNSPDHDEWAAVIRPYQALLLREQIYLNDPGASLYLLGTRAKDGWTGPLRFYEGEVYRLRNAAGDAAKAASAYAAATTLADAPPEAWRAHGYALLKAGRKAEAHEALDRYLISAEAADAAMIRFTLTQRETDDETTLAAGRMIVEPGSNWKRLYADLKGARWDAMWTWNGPQIDRLALVGGLPAGKALIIGADQQVPVFRADMTAQDLTSMLEVSYRIRGVTVFDIESVEPVDFLGGPGVKLRYNYASGIVIPKRGRCVMRVVGQKLYAMKLEGVANQSFDAVAAQFDQVVASARLSK
jgi:predicted Zn-dependent protease